MKIATFFVTLTCIHGFFKTLNTRYVISASKSLNLRMKSEGSYGGLKEYIDHLSKNAKLPAGFKVGAARFNFEPFEVAGKILPMNVTIIALDQPTPVFAALFTSNKFPGGPILVGMNNLKLYSYNCLLL